MLRELPVPPDKAWVAALQVITQSQVIVRVDRGAVTLEFLAAHSSPTAAKYFVHEVVAEFTLDGFRHGGCPCRFPECRKRPPRAIAS